MTTETNTDQATVSPNGASSPPEFPAVLSPAESVAQQSAPLASPTAAGAASVTNSLRDSLQDEIEGALSGMSYDELQKVAHFVDRLQSARRTAA